MATTPSASSPRALVRPPFGDRVDPEVSATAALDRQDDSSAVDRGAREPRLRADTARVTRRHGTALGIDDRKRQRRVWSRIHGVEAAPARRRASCVSVGRRHPSRGRSCRQAPRAAREAMSESELSWTVLFEDFKGRGLRAPSSFDRRRRQRLVRGAQVRYFPTRGNSDAGCKGPQCARQGFRKATTAPARRSACDRQRTERKRSARADRDPCADAAARLSQSVGLPARRHRSDGNVLPVSASELALAHDQPDRVDLRFGTATDRRGETIGTGTSATYLVFKQVQRLSGSWRKINGYRSIALANDQAA